jgi:hypothetical protein
MLEFVFWVGLPAALLLAAGVACVLPTVGSLFSCDEQLKDRITLGPSRLDEMNGMAVFHLIRLESVRIFQHAPRIDQSHLTW